MADVRARMRAAQQRPAAATAPARVASPWVRYTALGQPACTACFVTLKDDLLWPSHAASNKHRDAVAAALAQRPSTPAGPAPPAAAAATAAGAPAAAAAAAALTALAAYVACARSAPCA
jgi:hypothetical protein